MERSNRIGNKYTTKQGYVVTVIDYKNSQNVSVIFNDEKKTTLKGLRFYVVHNGPLNNPNHKTVFGIGYLGQGTHKSSINSIDTIEYSTWNHMIRRCYCEKQQKKQPSYIGCSVHLDWHNFQNYAKWYKENYVENYVVDKDILIKGNKVYGPDTCVFVPAEINGLFTKNDVNRGEYPIGVTKNKKVFLARLSINGWRKSLSRHKTPIEAFEAYKEAKENYIKEVANLWKSKISDNVYQALINYQVEITD